MKRSVMKTRNVLAMCAVGLSMLVATQVSAQEQKTSTESHLSPKLGVKGGINFTNLYVDNVKDENVKVGYNVGLFAKLPVTRGFSIQPELLYSSKGAKLSYSNFLQGSGEYRFNLDYLELPVLAVFNVAPNLNIHVGPYIGYLAHVNIKDVDDNGTINGVKELNADNFRRFDYGVAGGIGFDIQNFTIGARYNYGLQEVGKSGSLSGQLTTNSKNSAASVYIGLGF